MTSAAILFKSKSFSLFFKTVKYWFPWLVLEVTPETLSEVQHETGNTLGFKGALHLVTAALFYTQIPGDTGLHLIL